MQQHFRNEGIACAQFKHNMSNLAKDQKLYASDYVAGIL